MQLNRRGNRVRETLLVLQKFFYLPISSYGPASQHVGCTSLTKKKHNEVQNISHKESHTLVRLESIPDWPSGVPAGGRNTPPRAAEVAGPPTGAEQTYSTIYCTVLNIKEMNKAGSRQYVKDTMRRDWLATLFKLCNDQNDEWSKAAKDTTCGTARIHLLFYILLLPGWGKNRNSTCSGTCKREGEDRS